MYLCVQPEGAAICCFSHVASHPVQKQLGPVGSVGFAQAMKQKWIVLDKSSGQPLAKRKVPHEAKLLLL